MQPHACSAEPYELRWATHRDAMPVKGPIALSLLLAPSFAMGQTLVRNNEILEADSPEAWAMAYASSGHAPTRDW